MSVRLPYGSKVIVDSNLPGTIYAGMPQILAPKRGAFLWRRAGVPGAPSSKLRCELVDANDPKTINFMKTSRVVYDDGGGLGDAYMAAYDNLIGYNELVKSSPHDQTLRVLFLDAFQEMLRARDALARIAHP